MSALEPTPVVLEGWLERAIIVEAVEKVRTLKIFETMFQNWDFVESILQQAPLARTIVAQNLLVWTFSTPSAITRHSNLMRSVPFDCAIRHAH